MKGMRDTPATDLELHRMRRARETGKAPKPKWYTVPKPIAPIKYDMSQKYPAYVLSNFTRQSDPWLEKCNGDFHGKHWNTAADYIAAYDEANRLIPVAIDWVKTEGNFA